MKISEFRKLIREEVRKVIKEATLISKGTASGSSPIIKVNDTVLWHGSSNERGMRVSTGTYIGKVVKIIGSKNYQVEVLFPTADVGDIYKVAKDEITYVPAVGEVISAKYSWDGGQGSGSQGESMISGTVKNVDIANATLTIAVAGGKATKARLRDLSDIKVIKN